MDIKYWKFTDDQFDTETGDKVKKAIIKRNFHDRNLRLLAHQFPALLPLYIRYDVVHLTLIAAYDLNCKIFQLSKS